MWRGESREGIAPADNPSVASVAQLKGLWGGPSLGAGPGRAVLPSAPRFASCKPVANQLQTSCKPVANPVANAFPRYSCVIARCKRFTILFVCKCVWKSVLRNDHRKIRRAWFATGFAIGLQLVCNWFATGLQLGKNRLRSC